MRVATDVGALWGGSIYESRLDLSLHKLTFYVKVKEKNKLTFYELHFLGITNCIINNAYFYPFDYVELSTIEIRNEDSGVYAEMEIGSNEYTMVIKCMDYKLVIVAEEE